MKRKFIYIILILSMIMFTFGRGSASWFMNTVVSEENTFSTGTLEIGIGDGEKNIGTIDLEGLAPEKVLEQKIRIINNGTLPCKLYGIRFSAERINDLKELNDALKFQIYLSNTKKEEITALEIPVFCNYVGTILEDLIIFYPVTIDEEIQMVFRAELDMMQVEEKHSEVDAITLQFELLASQLSTPLQQLSERYLFLENYLDTQTAMSSIKDADILIIGEGPYECDRLLLKNKKNISIVGVWELNKPELKYMESNNIKTGNKDQYFLKVEDCSGAIIRDISLSYHKENMIDSNEVKDSGIKPKKPFYVDKCFNYVNIDLKGEFENQLVEDEGRENIILINGARL